MRYLVQVFLIRYYFNLSYRCCYTSCLCLYFFVSTFGSFCSSKGIAVVICGLKVAYCHNIYKSCHQTEICKHAIDTKKLLARV